MQVVELEKELHMRHEHILGLEGEIKRQRDELNKVDSKLEDVLHKLRDELSSRAESILSLIQYLHAFI